MAGATETESHVVPLLAQLPDRLPVPPIEYSAIAPELLLTTAALLLLLVTVGGPARHLVAGAGGVISGAIGVWLWGRGLALPGGVLVAVGAATLIAAVVLSTRPQLLHTWLAAITVAGALGLTAWQWAAIYYRSGARTALSGAVALDGIALYTRLTVLVSALLVLPLGFGYLRDRGIYKLEFEPLLLISVTGMTVLGAAADLLVVVIAIEVLSLPLYILAGFARRDRRSQEASIKYFLMGAVASAVLLYGVALLYVATGTVDLGFMSEGVVLVSTPIGVVLLGIAMVTVGLGFKASAVPFHLWTPDVYQGSPTNVTMFMAAGTKAAAFAALLRVFLLGFGRLDFSWVPVLATISAASMLLGALAAIVQRDVKRLLAYSSIAHVGYALIGVTSAGIAGLSATLWYLLTYAITSIGAFGCVIAIERRRRGEVALVDLRGMGRRSPLLAGWFALCLLSLAGIPGTIGFAGKLAVFRAGVDANLGWLVVLGVVSSVVSAFYYLRVLGSMVLEDPDDETKEPVLPLGFSLALNVSALLVILLGLMPDFLLTLADQAATLAR